MATDNTLKLQFNGNVLVRADGGTGLVEWISGSTDYKVSIEVNEDLYDPFTIILSDKNNEKALEVSAVKINGKKYATSFKIPRILKTGDRVNIGIIAQKKNKKDVVVSNALPVLISSGIAQPQGVTIDSKDVNNSGFAALLKLFKGGMVIKNVSIESETVGGAEDKYLYITYDTTEANGKKVKIGKVSNGLIGMGAQIIRKNGDGGGAKLGASSKLVGQQEGAAMGYNTEAGRGFAGGSGAKTHEGIAIGYGASAITKSNNTFVDGIAIGKFSSIDKDSSYATAIGGYSKITKSERSVAIGGGTNVNAGATLDKSPYSIAIGYKAKGERLSSGIVIGTNAGALGTSNTNSKTTQNPIAIGNKSYAAWGGAIAIGQNSLSGVVRNDDESINPIDGNASDDFYGTGKAQKKRQSVGSSSIAIGMNSNARRSQSIAIGRGADTYRWGAIAIGYSAVAGNEKVAGLDENSDYVAETVDKKTTSGYSAVAIGAYAKGIGSGSIALGNSCKATAASSVAIGSGATASASSAVQIGKGTNNKASSLQFRDKMLVENGKLQVNLTNDAISGNLPISKGGTGATTQLNALKNLGIYHGVQEIVFSSTNSKVTYADGNYVSTYQATVTYSAFLGLSKNFKFKNKPTIILTIEDETAVLYSFGIGVDSVNESQFTLRVQAGPNLYKKSAPYSEPYAKSLDKKGNPVFSNKMKIHYLIIGEK